MLSWEELADWQADWLHISKEAIEKRQAFLLDALSREQTHFTRAIQTLRNGRERLAHGYADMFTDQLELDSSVATTSNPNQLLEIAEWPGADKKPDRQRWFEAISRFDQAIAVGKIEIADSHETLDRDMNRLLKYFWKHFFTKGFEKVEIYCYHDAENGYGVCAEDLSIGHHLSRPGLVRRKSDLTCRKTLYGELSYIRHRNKDPFDTWLKTQRQIHDTKNEFPYVVNDRCGLTFIVPTMKELNDVALRLAEMLLDDPGAEEIEPLETNHGTSHSADSKNKQSDSGYKVAKTLLKWRGRVYEFQFLTFHDYFSSKRSLLDSNHELYRLRQTLKYFLPLLWPKEIYEIDWANPHVRSSLRKWKIDQLGWRVNGKHVSDS